MRLVFLFLGISIFLSSCLTKEKQYKKMYFDFDSLVSSQLIGIESSGVMLLKKVSLNSSSDSLSMTPNKTQWQDELQAFRQLDAINKPMYKGLYKIETKEDTGSNLLIRTYTTDKTNSVTFIKLFFTENTNTLKRIEAQIAETNMMIDTHRSLLIELDENKGMPRLTHYQVKNKQKMILSKAVDLSIEGWLKYSN